MGQDRGEAENLTRKEGLTPSGSSPLFSLAGGPGFEPRPRGFLYNELPFQYQPGIFFGSPLIVHMNEPIVYGLGNRFCP